MALRIELSGVSKRFGQTVALRSTDLVVEAGQTCALLGVSGCGKSTLLRLVCGLIEPDAGAVHVGEERMAPASALTLRRRMGYVIQEGGLFPHMTARQNVTVLARHDGRPPEEIAARVTELCTLTRLRDDVLDRYPRELSGGQRQRVALMRALFGDPEVLLLDEPLGALDPITRRELQDDLAAIFDELHKTVLLVTHDVSEAGFFGDFVALMQAGGIVQRGPIAELRSAPADPFVTRFLEAQRPRERA